MRVLSPFMVLCPALILAQANTQPAPPTQDSLTGITARGRMMYEYDQVAWHGSDAVGALRWSLKDTIHTPSVAYAAERTPTGWRFPYGEFTAARDTFLVTYEATRGAVDTTYTARHVVPTRAETGSLLAVARAAVLARSTFGSVNRAYNTIVMPATGGQWLAYMLPASSNAGWVLGADTRYRVSSDGRTVLESRRLHNSIVTSPSLRPGQPAPVYEVHSNVRDNVPEDTDVFLVLTRTPHIPELIVTDLFLYKIAVDGGITYVGRSEDLRKR